MMVCPPNLQSYRRPLHGYFGDSSNGYIVIPSRQISIVFSSGLGWEHVSVSRPDRCPTWDEMEWVKREFWSEEDTVMQLHVPVADHRNCHPYCLHLWRPLDAEIARPPAMMVAP